MQINNLHAFVDFQLSMLYAFRVAITGEIQIKGPGQRKEVAAHADRRE